MQIVSEVVFGIDNSGPSCCLSAERQRDVPNVVFKSFTHQAADGGESVSFVRALFLSYSGYFGTNVSLLPHLTVQT